GELESKRVRTSVSCVRFSSSTFRKASRIVLIRGNSFFRRNPRSSSSEYDRGLFRRKCFLAAKTRMGIGSKRIIEQDHRKRSSNTIRSEALRSLKTGNCLFGLSTKNVLSFRDSKRQFLGPLHFRQHHMQSSDVLSYTPNCQRRANAFEVFPKHIPLTKPIIVQDSQW